MFRPSNLGSYSTFNRVILKIFQTVRLIETVRLHRIWPEKLDHTVRTKLEHKYLHTDLSVYLIIWNWMGLEKLQNSNALS